MAINFPNAPINGEQYTDPATDSVYIWVEEYGYWKFSSSASAGGPAFAKANTANITADLSFNHANAAFITANTIWIHSNVSYEQANTARVHANASFLTANQSFAHANAAFLTANAGFAKANTANITADRAWNHANAAFLTANQSFAHANAGFLTANISFAHANAGFLTANISFAHANAAFDKANAASITIITDTTDSTDYVVFVSATSGSAASINVSTSLTYNPSTGVLSSTAFNSTSDANLKYEVAVIQNALDMVDRMEGVKFRWVTTGYPSMGVVAQNIEMVAPELVATNKEDHKSVNYDGLIAILIEAIKELRAEVNDLRTKYGSDKG